MPRGCEVMQPAKAVHIRCNCTFEEATLMPKALSISGMVVAVLLLLIFGLDLAVDFPFAGDTTMMDVGFVVCSIVLAYLSWSTFRELP